MKFEYYKSTGKIHSVKHYRQPVGGGVIECLDQSGQWFVSAHSNFSLRQFIKHGFMEKCDGSFKD